MDAMRLFREKSLQEIQEIAFEIGMLGQYGLDINHPKEGPGPAGAAGEDLFGAAAHLHQSPAEGYPCTRGSPGGLDCVGEDGKGQAEPKGLQDLHLTEMTSWHEGDRTRHPPGAPERWMPRRPGRSPGRARQRGLEPPPRRCIILCRLNSIITTQRRIFVDHLTKVLINVK